MPWASTCESVLANSDLYERERQEPARLLPLGRGESIPTTCGCSPTSGPTPTGRTPCSTSSATPSTTQHINPKLPYLLRSIAHINTTEAIALMMGSLAGEPGWIYTFADVPEEEIEADKLAARRRADQLVFVRWALVMFHFEQALYADPDREDLNTVWWDLVERFQLVERPPGRNEPDWAAKLHVALAPVYYHNYVLGDLIAAQLRNYLESYITRGPFYKNEAAGRYMLESFFGPGAREGWQDTVLRATGEPLNAEYFVESLRR